MFRCVMLFVLAFTLGCGGGKVEVNAPGVKLKVGENGVDINAPGVDVKAGKDGVKVDTDKK
jgi:hypothetical protein